jgi:hypothetical protein
MVVSGQLQNPAALPQENTPPSRQLNGSLGGPLSQSEACGEEKNLTLMGNEPMPSSP